MIRGYIDESHEGIKKPRFFTLSCTLADGGDWEFIEAAWRWRLQEKNRDLRSRGRKPISRYHAADCSNRNHEFQGWERKERDVFVVNLLETFRYFPTASVTLGMSAKDISEVWPENDEDPLHFAYNILLRLIMLEIGNLRSEFRLHGKISLIHERCGKYGESLLRGFNTMMDDPTFSYRDVFTTIKPMGWEDCLPLQPADLVAYEIFRDTKRRAALKEMNKSLAALREMPAFRLASKIVSKENLITIRKMHDRQIARAKLGKD